MKPKALLIGQIRYTNTLPVNLFFDESRFADQIDFIQQVPDHLASYVLHMTASTIVFLVKAEQALP